MLAQLIATRGRALLPFCCTTAWTPRAFVILLLCELSSLLCESAKGEVCRSEAVRQDGLYRIIENLLCYTFEISSPNGAPVGWPELEEENSLMKFDAWRSACLYLQHLHFHLSTCTWCTVDSGTFAGQDDKTKGCCLRPEET